MRGEDTAKQAPPTPPLFPILPSRPVGLARLAAQATHADDGHLVEFRTLQARSLMSRCRSKRQLTLEWSINPYRGCEFGCKYCYARYTHQFLQPGTIPEIPIGRYDAPVQPWATDFERTIYLKENAPWLLEQELGRIDPSQEIAIGTATDPYQPIERRAGLTRSLLEVFTRRSGHKLGIITKSNLILRDTDLLTRVAERNTLVVHLTITTTDAALARKLESRAPRPDLRFAAVRRLRAAGIPTGILCSPLLPGINDSEPSLDRVARAAAESRASFLAAFPLFLKSCSRPTWLSFVREHFPHLASEYDRRFATADFASAPYRRHMAAILHRVCRRYDIPERFLTPSPEQSTEPSSNQLPEPSHAQSAVRRRPPAPAICAPAQQKLFA